MTPHRILVVRLSAIGDVVMASGVIPVLRRAYPQAYIAWLAESGPAQLLQANPRLDEVIIWPRGEWQRVRREQGLRAWMRQVRAFRKLLRERHFDLVLDAQGLLKSGVWAWSTHAKERIGLGSREGSQWLMTRVLSRDCSDERRISSEYYGLMQQLGLDPGAFALDLAVTADDTAAVARLLAGRGVTTPYAVIAPFTTRAQKHWFEECWTDLAPRLRARFGFDVVMLGGSDDRGAAARIEAQAGGSIVNLVGATTLRQSVAVIQKTALLIGVDTGLTHMGTATQRPTVALFGSTRPYLDPAVPTTRIIYDAMECSPCHRHPTCGGAFTCMRLITVERVLETARAALEAGVRTERD
ncbi:MAG TPA: glycosyltransferase family 9 protein [Nevskiaceae bacterium]|nr:glycosyltransferase family 9 protein [Nevskiaceae bacterium]